MAFKDGVNDVIGIWDGQTIRFNLDTDHPWRSGAGALLRCSFWLFSRAIENLQKTHFTHYYIDDSCWLPFKGWFGFTWIVHPIFLSSIKEPWSKNSPRLYPNDVFRSHVPRNQARPKLESSAFFHRNKLEKHELYKMII